MLTKREKYNNWLTEEFMMDQIEKTPDDEERFQKMFEYLQLLKDWDEELELE